MIGTILDPRKKFGHGDDHDGHGHGHGHHHDDHHHDGHDKNENCPNGAMFGLKHT